MAGISGIMNGVFSAPKKEEVWRTLFLVGLIIGAALFQFLTQDSLSAREGYPLWLIIIGGFLVGFGTRLGSAEVTIELMQKKVHYKGSDGCVAKFT
jgi:uncharacterized membrane protein YedE/YeeE